jgi:oxalate decarboxylase
MRHARASEEWPELCSEVEPGGTIDFQAGDVAAVPLPMGHDMKNIGDTTQRFLEICRNGHYADVSPAQSLAFTPRKSVRSA